MFTGCNRVQKGRARHKWFQGLGYDCLVSKYSTKSGEELACNEVQTKRARRKLLVRNGENNVWRF